MIVGTIALLTILFGGGVSEIFFVDKLEKGIKEFILDKDRKKEILDDLKTSKAFIKEFNKGRKSQMKDFNELNASYNTTSEELIGLFNDLQDERIDFQDSIIDDRIAIANKITFDEWVLILDYSNIQADIRIANEMEAADKAIEKGKVKEPFIKTRDAINEAIPDEEKQKFITDGLNDMIRTFNELGLEINTMNVQNNDVLIRKDAGKEELKVMVDEMNVLRNLSFNQVLNFHMLVREHSSETEFEPIMKAFNKELSITEK
jgi:hypothetical protein